MSRLLKAEEPPHRPRLLSHLMESHDKFVRHHSRVVGLDLTMYSRRHLSVEKSWSGLVVLENQLGLDQGVI